MRAVGAAGSNQYSTLCYLTNLFIFGKRGMGPEQEEETETDRQDRRRRRSATHALRTQKKSGPWSHGQPRSALFPTHTYCKPPPHTVVSYRSASPQL